MTLVVNTNAKAHSLSQDRTSTSAGFNQPKGDTDLQYTVEDDEPLYLTMVQATEQPNMIAESGGCRVGPRM
ncbi:hypothetical protein NEUTE1DRAFT_42533 [Neurospora tetrasperma FGSC 2508]|uniref:Uncharacterized protein n=1 Tax=Neurospora tetrasperma (strain FGSC 2508 / ATCC MYA-4615 / P0657) TaxID=510951 RepID=F8MMX4_NEUT8|nr:uncharacterized protein NEUTE1DRAFT_42533 [Neurospora tetrasperma FGSC 2508]EGO57998.1 hypothetical protein NEUTE1DRAFT_42533 [Neurospora tetrasperma FGSC 2508]EGZ71698.1 hypothetical protein NEUTE2DRAFT_65276 [Neurospora tetrasperma FGSC 2509]